MPLYHLSRPTPTQVDSICAADMPAPIRYTARRESPRDIPPASRAAQRAMVAVPPTPVLSVEGVAR